MLGTSVAVERIDRGNLSPLTVADMISEKMRMLRRNALPVIQCYVRERLIHRLGRAVLPTIEPMKHGWNDLVYTIAIEGQPTFVLRANRMAGTLRRRMSNHDALKNVGVEIPQIAFADFGRAVRRRFGYGFLVEHYVPGADFGNGTIGRKTAMLAGNAFARLHSVTSVCCGKAGRRFRLRPLKWTLQRKVQQWLALYQSRGFPYKESIDRWFAAQWSNVRCRSRLCHGDAATTNVLVSREQIALLDLAEVHFFFAPWEVASIEHRLLGEEVKATTSFHQAYLSVAPVDLHMEMESSLNVGRAMFRLERVVAKQKFVQRKQYLTQLWDIVLEN